MRKGERRPAARVKAEAPEAPRQVISVIRTFLRTIAKLEAAREPRRQGESR